MRDEKTILVCGVDAIASAVAHRLFKEGYAVALLQETAPEILRRRMTFADTWFDGAATLDGVSAQRARTSADFLSGLRGGEYIPLLPHCIEVVTDRWPWDVVVATREADPTPRLKDRAACTIGLGEGYAAGANCDFAIETDGPDPGAILREGAVPRRCARRRETAVTSALAPASGVFRSSRDIGAVVISGEAIGETGGAPVTAPVGGRIGGLLREGRAVAKDTPVAEIFSDGAAGFAGISRRAALVARGVSFALEMEFEGWAPVSFDDWT